MWRSQKRSVQLRLGYDRFDRIEDNKAPLREGAGCAVAVVLSFRKVKKTRSLEHDVSKRQVYRLMRGVQKGNRTLPRLIEPTLVTAQ